MKKRFLILATVVVGLGLTACDTSSIEDSAKRMQKSMEKKAQMEEEAKEAAEANAESTSTVMYQCPDDCENGPAFFDEGPCKKCGKDMVEI